LRPVQSPVAPSDSPDEPLEAAVKVSGLRILVVEDDEINQRVALRLLERQGHLVTVVGDGRAALEAVAAQEFDCVLMDMEMPDLDGLEATRIIRRNEAGGESHLPIIAMTANAMQGDQQRCLEAGMDGYVSKPVAAQALNEVLERLVGWSLEHAERSVAHVEPVPEPQGEDNAPGQVSAPESDPERYHEPVSPASSTSVAELSASTSEGTEASPDIAAAMRKFGNEWLFTEMTRQFLSNYPEMMLNLCQAIEDDDHGSTRLIARSLKDLLGMFGADLAYNLSLRLEMMAHAGDVSQARPVFDDLEREMLLLSHAIKRAVPAHST